LLSKAKGYTNKILFVGLFPVIDELLQPFPWSTSGKCYSTERMKLFNDALVKFCMDNDLQMVDLWSAFESVSNMKSLFFDGIHPNDAGHQLIYETAKPKLKELSDETL
jgi:lysophospholipase L1-like esterase